MFPFLESTLHYRVCPALGVHYTVLLSELSSNAGDSITSACESIVTDLVTVKNLNPKKTRWIQHDLPHDGEASKFDEIRFTWHKNEVATDPEWFELEIEQTEALTGSSADELNRRLGSVPEVGQEEVSNQPSET